MYYVTGDIHGSQILWDICITGFLRPGDTIIIPGDFGIGFFDGKYWSEEMFYDYLAEQEYTVLFCDGNHENFEKLRNYEVSEWCRGRVHYIRNNVIHLMRGEIYTIDKKKMFVMGGGYSVDKEFRIPGKTWWPEEMPNDADYNNASENLKKHDYSVDYILTHTAPSDTVEYMSQMGRGIKNTVFQEAPLTGYLKWVEEVTEYQRWYFGHFHIDANLWKNQVALFDDIRELHTGKLVRKRV